METSISGFEHVGLPASATNSAGDIGPDRHTGPRKYWEEWMDLFEDGQVGSKLRQLALSIKLADCRFRSICWKVFLECLPESREDWIYVTRERRSKYTTLLNIATYNPRQGTRDLDLDLNNPLSQDESSPWNQYFEDSELKITIKQDVIRTFPEIEFFQTPDVQQMMVNILFCYARQHPQVSYRQGMHELLAPIIFVLHSDQRTFLHALELGYVNEFPSPIRDDIRELLNPDFTEHDAFFLFSQVMEAVESWYTCLETTVRIDQFGFTPFSKSNFIGLHNVLGVKLCKINEQMLKRIDYNLYNYLEGMEIPLHVFGIRWLRLLFGREFSLPDLLIIWDAIFADSLTFCLVDFIFVAMLICIRDKVLNADYTQCLSYLMKYPGGSHVTYIIQMALHLKHPMWYAKPCGKLLIHSSSSCAAGCGELSRTSVPRTEAVNNAKTSRRPRTLALSGYVTQALKANSEPTTLDSGSEASDGDDESSLRGDRAPSRWHSARKSGYNTWTVGRGNAITRSLNHLVNSSGDSSGREMVTLKAKDPASTTAGIAESQGTSSKKCATEDNAKLRQIMKNCSDEMSVHLASLQTCLCSQKLQQEDKMLLSVASLKRVRDTLKEAADLSDMEEEIATDAEQMDDWTVITATKPGEGSQRYQHAVPPIGSVEQTDIMHVACIQEAKKKLLEQTIEKASDGGDHVR